MSYSVEYIVEALACAGVPQANRYQVLSHLEGRCGKVGHHEVCDGCNRTEIDGKIPHHPDCPALKVGGTGESVEEYVQFERTIEREVTGGWHWKVEPVDQRHWPSWAHTHHYGGLRTSGFTDTKMGARFASRRLLRGIEKVRPVAGGRD